MKKYLAIGFLSTGFLLNMTQISAQKNTEWLSMHKSAFETAMQHRDPNTAIIAANYIVGIEGAKSTYLDSVAYLYSVTRQLASCQAVCERILTVSPEKLDIMELKARCLMAENKLFDAISIYEFLFKKTNDIGFGYTLAKLQLAGKRLLEAMATANALVKIPQNPNQPRQVVEPIGTDGETQTIGIVAAIHNLRGLIAYQIDPEKNVADAHKCFDQAIQLEPNYDLAKQNKSRLDVATTSKKSDSKPK